MKSLGRIVLFLSLFMAAGCDAPGELDAETNSPRTTHLENLTIVSADGVSHSFRVELADTDEERARGLMFRRSMAPDAGMLFDFGRQSSVSMWMKNTYLPLDMLFIGSDGVIVTIAENTEPHSLKSIPSGVPVMAVLELNAGTASRLEIKTGDRVDHPLFNGP